AHRLGSLVRRTELLRVKDHLLPEPLGGEDFVHEADLLRPVERERLALDHHLDRAGLAHDAGQSLRAARTGQHPQVHLGKADLVLTLLGEPQIARHADLEPTPTVWPFSAAIVSLGVCSRRLSVSFACRQKKYL